MKLLPIFTALLLLALPSRASVQIYDSEPARVPNLAMQWLATGQQAHEITRDVAFSQAASIESIGVWAFFQPNPAYPYEIFPGAPLEMTMEADLAGHRVWQAPLIEFTPTQGRTGPYDIFFFDNGPDGLLNVSAGETLTFAVSFAEIQPYQDPTGRWVFSESGFYGSDDGGLAMQTWGEQTGAGPQVEVCEPAAILLGAVVCLLLCCRFR